MIQIMLASLKTAAWCNGEGATRRQPVLGGDFELGSKGEKPAMGEQVGRSEGRAGRTVVCVGVEEAGGDEITWSFWTAVEDLGFIWETLEESHPRACCDLIDFIRKDVGQCC